MINLKNSEFFYDPYPFAIVKNIFEKEIYDDLKKEFPDPNDTKFYSSDYSKILSIIPNNGGETGIRTQE